MRSLPPVSYTHLDVYKRQGKDDVIPVEASVHPVVKNLYDYGYTSEQIARAMETDV